MASQLVANPGFETQPASPPWVSVYNFDGSLADPFSHQGSFAARLSAPFGHFKGVSVFQPIADLALPGGTLVKLSFFAKKDPDSVEANPESDIIAVASLNDSAGISVATILITIPAGRNPRGGTSASDFSYYEGDVKIPDGATVTFALLAIANMAPSVPGPDSQVVIDDVFLEVI